MSPITMLNVPTNTKAFSLALGSKDEREGVVLFGGLDISKFAGFLQTLPIIPGSKGRRMSMVPSSRNSDTAAWGPSSISPKRCWK